MSHTRRVARTVPAAWLRGLALTSVFVGCAPEPSEAPASVPEAPPVPAEEYVERTAAQNRVAACQQWVFLKVLLVTGFPS